MARSGFVESRAQGTRVELFAGSSCELIAEGSWPQRHCQVAAREFARPGKGSDKVLEMLRFNSFHTSKELMIRYYNGEWTGPSQFDQYVRCCLRCLRAKETHQNLYSASARLWCSCQDPASGLLRRLCLILATLGWISILFYEHAFTYEYILFFHRIFVFTLQTIYLFFLCSAFLFYFGRFSGIRFSYALVFCFGQKACFSWILTAKSKSPLFSNTH